MSWHSLLRALTGGHFPRLRTTAFLPGSHADDASWRTAFHGLGIPDETFHDVLHNNGLAPHFGYRHFHKRKRDGSKRDIHEPDTRLKQIQHLLLRTYLASQQPHPAAIAYRSGRSVAHHVWPHAKADVIVTADVQDFFPTTTAWRIERWWQGEVDDESARLFTLLTTQHDGLPQGAPTSPALSNLVNVELDTRLALHIDASGGRYTRYCDDMVFSWSRGAMPPGDFANRIRSILYEFGYALHPTKGWCEYERSDEPTITGLVLGRDGRVRLPAHVRAEMVRLAGSREPEDVARLMGYLGFAAMVKKRTRRAETDAASPHELYPSPVVANDVTIDPWPSLGEPGP